jgi:hypothetical protein
MKTKPIINVKLSDEVSEFLRMNSTMVEIDGLEYYQPAQFWYTQAFFGNANIFQVHTELPTYKQQDNE